MEFIKCFAGAQTRLKVFSWPAFIRVLILVLIGLTTKANAQFDQINITTTAGVTTVKIDRPDVTVPSKVYPNIKFTPGQTVHIEAGGCVQTGGKGKTWKLYVSPSGGDSSQLYHGEIDIPGITTGLTFLQNLVGHTWTVQDSGVIGGIAGSSVLSLGYTDNHYQDNSYSAHDNGTNDQCLGIGNAYVVLTITTPSKPVQQTFTTSRISGLAYFQLDAKDSKDNVSELSGVLCVVHNPGCGIKGNDGTDTLFNSGLNLPAGVTVEQFNYVAQPPHEWPLNDSGVPGSGEGSYGTSASPLPFNQSNPKTSFRWFNACQLKYNNQNNYYMVSLVVSAPEGMYLGESPTNPLVAQPPCAPDPFLNPVGVTKPVAAPKISGVIFSVEACNPSAQSTTATLVISATCQPPLKASAGASCQMNETIKSTLSAGGPVPGQASFATKLDYQDGTWTIMKATLNNAPLPANGGPMSFVIPGTVGAPVLSFSSGSCPLQAAARQLQPPAAAP